MKSSTKHLMTEPVLTPRDMVAGLGGAPRELLAACLALFDDTTLRRRLQTRYDALKAKLDNSPELELSATSVNSVRSRIDYWREQAFSDNALRIILWMYIREAFTAEPYTFASYRAGTSACDDVVARALLSVKPGMVARILKSRSSEEVPTTLDSLARSTLKEMLSNIFDRKDAQSQSASEELLAVTRQRLEALNEDDRSQLLNAIGADSMNDAAIRKIILTGGGLTSLGAGVSMAGFSAFILAAQVSAFIPLVSGPALVSVVAVMSNPITILTATLGMSWWATRSANQKIRAAVGIRVMSLLTLNGLGAKDEGIRNMTSAFSELGNLTHSGELNNKVLKRYQYDWACIEPARKGTFELDSSVANIMEHRAGIHTKDDRLLGLINDGGLERKNATALSVMTLGDIAYNAFNIDPTVLEAIDFARTAVLDDPIAFASFAQEIESMTPAAQLGAISNIKGYVAERVVASQLVTQGHVVEFPEMSNQAGWDLSVDGIKFQVKDVSDLSALQSHFDKGYEYPIIANAEIANQLSLSSDTVLPEWSDKIHFVEGYSNEVVEHVTRESIRSGDDLINPDVPLFALILSSARNLSRMSRGEVTGSQALQEILLDGGMRAGLAAIGGYAGNGIGLLVFGPAGGLVLGGIVPIISQTQSGRLKAKMDKWVQSKPYRNWSTDARMALDDLVIIAEAALKSKADFMKQRSHFDGMDYVSKYVQWRLNQDICFLREAFCRLRAIRNSSTSVEVTSRQLISWLSTSTIHPAVYQSELNNLEKVFRNRPTVANRLTDTSIAVGQMTGKWLNDVQSPFKK